jgi:hypothetical protein
MHPIRNRWWAIPVVLGVLLLTGASGADVVVNEIMYNPATEQGSDSYFEWVELWNAGASAIDLTAWTLTDGEGTFVVDSGTRLAGGHFAVIARNPDSLVLQPEYADDLGDGNDILLGPATLSLTNTSDEIVLVDPLGTTVDSVQYYDGPEDNWPVEPDGGGPTLELRDPHLNNNLGTSWAASTETYGTPGDTNSAFSSKVSETRRNPRISQKSRAMTCRISRGGLHVQLDLEERAHVSLELYDTAGKRLFDVYSGPLEAGTHEMSFEQEIPAGTYVLHCTLDERTLSSKVLVLR